MSWQIVRLQDAVPMPWRNGGGSTRELLAWPDASNWRCRLSVAEVVQDGPFSRFDGVQRWFAVLSGAGVRLTAGSHSHRLTMASPPFAFDGGAPPDCALVDGPTQDFNLMHRGGRAGMGRVDRSHALSVRAGQLIAGYAHAEPATLAFQADTVELAPQGLAWRITDVDGTLEIAGTDALWMTVEVEMETGVAMNTESEGESAKGSQR